MKCLKTCCITLVIILVLLVGGTVAAAFIVTPDMLGLGGFEIYAGKTIDELGLGETKLVDVIKTAATLLNGADKSQCVDHAYTEADKESALAKTEGKGAEGLINGEVSGEFTDKEVGALLNDYYQQALQNGSAEDGMLKELSESGFAPTIEQLKVEQDASGNTVVSTVIGVNFSELLKGTELEGQINIQGQQFITIAAPVKIDDGGDVVANGDADFGLAGVPESVAGALTELLGEMTGGEGGEGGEGIGEMLSGFLAETLNGMNVSGFGNGQITFGN